MTWPAIFAMEKLVVAGGSSTACWPIELFVYRLGRELGWLAAVLGGLAAIVFTAGVGIHSTLIREEACHAAAWLNFDLDAAAHAA